MSTLARGALPLLLVAAATACSESTYSESTYSPPAAVTPTSPPVAGAPPAPFPALSKPGTIYNELASAYSVARRSPTISRYVLYDDGTHALQIANAPAAMEFKGSWTRTDSTVVFEWEGWSVAGPWGATATVRGNELVVRYNLIMLLSDFEDATYVRLWDGT